MVECFERFLEAASLPTEIPIDVDIAYQPDARLFEAMGMESWVTQASRDDGVDGVRALAGVMDDVRASRGVLVTTSHLGKASHDFAERHGRIQLIEGPSSHAFGACVCCCRIDGFEIAQRTDHCGITADVFEGGGDDGRGVVAACCVE